MAAADTAEELSTIELTPQQVSARRWQLHVIAVVVILIDQLSKWWAVTELAGGNRYDGPADSSLRLVYNTGSAFSFGERFGPIFGLLAVVVSVSLFWIVARVEDRRVVFGLGLVQGGALGNVIDRLFREGDGFLKGPVIDFIEVVDFWPVFNLADAAIVVGGVIVVAAGSRA